MKVSLKTFYALFMFASLLFCLYSVVAIPTTLVDFFINHFKVIGIITFFWLITFYLFNRKLAKNRKLMNN
jgi:hypothetical protein